MTEIICPGDVDTDMDFNYVICVYPFQVSEPFKPTTVMDGLRYHEINVKHLKPSTTYLVSVRSVYWNNLSSDSSQEVEFTTCECRLYSPVSF